MHRKRPMDKWTKSQCIRSSNMRWSFPRSSRQKQCMNKIILTQLIRFGFFLIEKLCWPDCLLLFHVCSQFSGLPLKHVQVLDLFNDYLSFSLSKLCFFLSTSLNCSQWNFSLSLFRTLILNISLPNDLSLVNLQKIKNEIAKKIYTHLYLGMNIFWIKTVECSFMEQINFSHHTLTRCPFF